MVWDPDFFPDRFSYLRDVVRKYAPVAGWGADGDWRRKIAELSAAELDEIRRVHDEILRRDDVKPISAWLIDRDEEYQVVYEPWIEASHEAESKGLPIPPRPENPVAANFFQLFDELADRRIPPFNLRAVKFSPPPELPPDWTKLPPSLAYLCETEKWGHYMSDRDRDRLDRTITREQLNELRALGERMRADWQQIWQWTQQYRMTKHVESWIVYNVGMLVDEFAPATPREGLDEFMHPGAETLDWKKLPSSLRYLASPAQRFGYVQTPHERAEFMLEMGEQQERTGKYPPRFDELWNLAQRLRSPEERERIEEWFEAYPVGCHPEAVLVHCLITMLDEYFPNDGAT